LGDLRRALEAFKSATAHLSGVWQRVGLTGDEIAGYPACLPSFEEFACDVADMRVARGQG
jgi:hypothetical protein